MARVGLISLPSTSEDEPVSHMTVAVVALGAGLLAGGCSSSAVDAADSALARHFLEPLRQADIDYAVEDTCHLGRDSEAEPWHLEVRVRVDADAERLAQVLEAEDVVVGRDRDPMTIQQEQGDPAGGWNGVLETAGDGASSLGLTHNNVVVDRVGDAGGWAEVCRLADET